MNKRNLFLYAALTALSVSATAQTMNITRAGDTTIVKIAKSPKCLLLPIEEGKDEAQVILDNGKKTDTWMDVRLAQGKTDYYVPFKLNKGKTSVVKILNLKEDALALKKGQMKLSEVWDVTNTDFYRPSYHHTPSYGWMNDPVGMFYKDGVYHLCYQYNPYGSMWGNMHWGHAVSRDLIHWKEVEPTLHRDPMGHIFSGSTVIDKDGTAGYGKNAVISLYTSDSKENAQTQCMAYSTDGGYTFHKYEKNPVLKPFDGVKDFRDPKVFWYEPLQKWYMIVSADKEMRFYSSPNLKDWTYVSAFGAGYGSQPNQFECPDFFELPVDGNPNKKKWVMIVNINPGCLFGGSATEYFVGDFDGTNFTCDSDPSVAKFLDYGKDHYATVTFSGVKDRVLGIAWMSNWQYANVTPIRQYRGANTLPREFKLFTGKDGEIYMSSNVVSEVVLLRRKYKRLPDLLIAHERDAENVSVSKENAFELEMDVTPNKAAKTGIVLYNDKGEKVDIYFDMKVGRLVMDRTESGKVKFGEKSEPHKIETDYDDRQEQKALGEKRKVNSINYQNDFALGTWAPLSLCDSDTYHLNIFVDKCSIEIFVNGGRISMTNLVFPTAPYTSIKFYSDGNRASFKNIKVCELGILKR